MCDGVVADHHSPAGALSLSLCDDDSVDIYHASLPSVRIELEYEFTPASVKAFFAKVAQLDAERLHAVFALKGSGSALLTGVAQASRTEKERAAKMLSTAMYEVLSQRRLLSDFRVVRVISKVGRSVCWTLLSGSGGSLGVSACVC